LIEILLATAHAAAAPQFWNSLPSDIRQPDCSTVSLDGHLIHKFFLSSRTTVQCELC